tara:strand:+ start:2480 stop:3163 length:684 start_codon:yes stop_codon:yes gene_type:complete
MAAIAPFAQPSRGASIGGYGPAGNDEMKAIKALGALALLMTLPATTLAHGGGIDRQGCHDNRKAGGYHCHRGPLAGKTFRSQSDAKRVLGQPPAPVEQRPIVGKARIVDGNTMEVAGRRIYLFGIDAPSPGEVCEAAGKKWACGQNAVFGLSAIVERQWVHCLPRTRNNQGKIAAVCRLAGADGPDINAAMVRQGWAKAVRGGAAAYLAEETAARAAKAGIWAGLGR